MNLENNVKNRKVWKFGDDVSTDAIIPGRYLTTNDPYKLAEHVFEGSRPDFSKKFSTGDIIVAGENFGCGSSREHAPLSLIGAGVSCIVAESFARIFFRNAINVGLRVYVCENSDMFDDGDLVEIKEDNIFNLSKSKKCNLKKPPEFIDKIVEKGGLLKYTKDEIL